VERRIKKNFLRLKDMMDNNHERTKELLANIDRESDAIKNNRIRITSRTSRNTGKYLGTDMIFLIEIMRGKKRE
jgi:hypothetical protein